MAYFFNMPGRRRLRVLLAAGLACLWALPNTAQTLADNRRRYESGKELVRQGKYDLSQEMFRPLMRELPENPFAAHAHYLSAFAAFKARKTDEARLTLEQLLQKYPAWPDADQARYLLAGVWFEKKDPSAALATASGIRAESLRRETENLKKHHLQAEKSLPLLKSLRQKYPDDRILTEILADKLWFSPDAADQAQAQRLDAELGRKRPARPAPKPPGTRTSYNVAVVLPFEYAKLAADKSGRASPIAIDLYNGIRLAQQQLDKEALRLNLQAYDVGADADKMMALVNRPDFRNTDLLIGPVNGAAIRVAVAFANQTRIGQINPITTNGQIVQAVPSAYLYQPSVETQARQAARFARKQFATPTAAVFFGGSPRDSLLARAYRDAFVQAGGKVSVFRGVKAGTDLTRMTSVVEQGGLGHVFVSTTNQTVAINLVSALEKLPEPVPVVAPSNWLDYTMLSYDQFERLQFHFITPDYLDYRSEAAIAFRQAYVKQCNLIPSVYAYQGYDMMLFFGRLLKEHGTDFHQPLKSRPPARGAIFAGYDYRGGNDNQYVPIARFENGNFVLANAVE